MTLEQRRKAAAAIDRRVRGTTAGYLRISTAHEAPPVCERCGGPLPCECGKPACRPLPNYTREARREYDELIGKRAPARDALADAKADYELLKRGKYTQSEVDKLGAKGHAFRNPDGHFSFPIDDAQDLAWAIRGVGRAPADLRPKIRVYIIGRARQMGLSSMIPDTWAANGTLK